LNESPLFEYTAVYWGHHGLEKAEEASTKKVLELVEMEQNIICASQVLLGDKK
jgi:hypothetical protein